MGKRITIDPITRIEGHLRIEVEVEGQWRRIDSYINDEPFYLAGKHALKVQGWKTGYSVACRLRGNSNRTI